MLSLLYLVDIDSVSYFSWTVTHFLTLWGIHACAVGFCGKHQTNSFLIKSFDIQFPFKPPAKCVRNIVVSGCFSSHRITWVSHGKNEGSHIEQWRSEVNRSKSNIIMRLFYREKKWVNVRESVCDHWRFQC